SGGLAGAVGAEEGDHLARLDGETDAIDGSHFLILAPKKTADGAKQALFLLENTVDLGQVLRLDDGHACRLSSTSTWFNCRWARVIITIGFRGESPACPKGYDGASSTRSPTARISASALLCRTTPGCS